MRSIVLTALATLATLATDPAAALADDVMVVPFGGDLGGDRATLAGQLGAATVEVAERAPGTDAQLAQISRAEVLALASCPDAARGCIGKLAKALVVDRAITATLAVDGDRLAIDVIVVDRDGAVRAERIALESSATPDALVERYRAELSRLLAAAPATGAAPPAGPSTTPATASDAAGTMPPGLTRAPPGATSASGGDDRATIRPRTWAVIGGAAIGLALGTAFLIKADRTEEAILAAPTESAGDLRALRELERRGDTERTTGVALLAIAGAAAVSGGVLLALDLRRARRTVAVAPTATPGAVGLAVGGQF